MKKQLLRLCSLFLLSCLLVSPTAAQELGATIISNEWSAEFREHLTFTMTAETEAEVTEVYLFYKVIGQLATSRSEAEFTSGTTIEASFSIDQTLPANYLPTGAEIEFWWRLVDANGNEFTTERQRLTYIDERFSWRELQNERVTLHWYEGSVEFGQSLFERANFALDTLEVDANVTIEEPIDIFIYGNQADLLSALSTAAQEWTGGVAFTRYGVVVIGINPIQLEWGLRAMTHEITHLVIHQATDNPYGDLPRWLDEGIAVYNEDREALVDDFRPILNDAIANDTVLTLRTLSSPFPSDPLQANLAYGQSGQVVRFIIERYGSEAMGELLEIFAEGELYDTALEQALGVNTDELNNQWRVSVGLDPLPNTSYVPAPEVEAEAATVTQGDTAPVEEAAEDVPPTAAEEAPTEEADTAPSGVGLMELILCFLGLTPFFALAGFVVMRR